MPKSKPHYFFKVFFPDQSASRLRIPPAFWEHIGAESGKKVSLKGPSGSIWKVNLVKSSDGFIFEDGWKKFVEDQSLVMGDFLLFRYDGHSRFKVLVFDSTACEKNKAFLVRPSMGEEMNVVEGSEESEGEARMGEEEEEEEEDNKPLVHFTKRRFYGIMKRKKGTNDLLAMNDPTKKKKKKEKQFQSDVDQSYSKSSKLNSSAIQVHPSLNFRTLAAAGTRLGSDHERDHLSRDLIIPKQECESYSPSSSSKSDGDKPMQMNWKSMHTDSTFSIRFRTINKKTKVHYYNGQVTASSPHSSDKSSSKKSSKALECVKSNEIVHHRGSIFRVGSLMSHRRPVTEEEVKRTLERAMSFKSEHPFAIAVMQDSYVYTSFFMDCYIDICSPEVLSLFTDNFDYQHLRRHFVKGLLVDDIMGYKIFTHEIHSSYAARVDNFRSYDTISKDIMQRWTYPLVPDVQYFGNCSGIKLDRQGVYKAPEVIQSRSAQIGPFSLIGEGTTIGDHSSIFNSVIGKGCTIGRNVSIQGSYIWDNVTIEDDCKINYAVVCDGVHLSVGVVLEPGVILSFKVEVGQQFEVPAYSKVSLLPQPSKQDSDEELEYADTNSGVIDSPLITSMANMGKVDLMLNSLGTEDVDTSEVCIAGAGYIWSVCETGLEEEWRHSIAPIPVEKLNEFSHNSPADFDESNQDVVCLPASGELLPDNESGGFDDYKDSADFEKEVEATFRRALTGVEQDNVIIEINSLRLSYSMSHADCAGALFYSIIKSAYDSPCSSAKELCSNTTKEIGRWKDLLKNYLRTKDEEIEVIMKFEEMCLETARDFSPLFTTILNHLYENDIISEDAILIWANEKEGADESDRIFVKQAEQFITWLREASEEDDDEEE